MFRGPLPYKFEPGRQVIEVLRGKDVIATIHTNDEGAGAIRIVTLCLLSVERSDLEGHAGASAVKIRFAGEARDDERWLVMRPALRRPCGMSSPHRHQPVGRHFELHRSFLNRGGRVRRLWLGFG
jgi:hypothetical protein